MISLPLESDFPVIRLQSYLQQHPEQAVDIVLRQYQALLALAGEYNRLKAELNLLTTSHPEAPSHQED